MAKQIMKKLTKEKIPNKFIAVFLILALTFSNVMSLGIFLISGARVLASDLSELENQTMQTQSQNVEFDAYFMLDTGERVHSTSNRFGETKDLNIELNVKQEGYLKDAKIEILDTNFSITQILEETETVQNMDSKTNEIILKRITEGTDVIYSLPIKTDKNEYFNINDFSKNNIIRLTGTYVDNYAQETAVNKEIIINTEWYGDIEIKLDQKIEKFVPFTTAESKGVLVQLLVTADVKDKENSLPVKSTTIFTMAPKLNGFEPVDVKIASNGTALTNGRTIDNLGFDENNYTYSAMTGELKISVQNDVDKNGNVWSGYIGRDEYLLTYLYSAEAYDSINGDDITLDSNLTGEIHGYNAPSQTNPVIHSTEDNKQFIVNEKIGEVIEYSVEYAKGSINKGYMYTKLENNDTSETVYDVDWIANIGYINGEELIMKSTTPSVSNAENLYDNTNYTSTQVSLASFDKVLGLKGYIEIYDGDTLIGRIDENTEPDENGMLKVGYKKTDNIIIKTSAPVEIGILKITNTKSIGEGYTLNKLKGYKNINITLNNKESLIKLKEPTTNAILETNKNRISASNVNENVEIKVTLQRNGVQYSLFQNPVIYIEFPSFVKDLNIKDLSLMYADGLEIDMQKAKTTHNDKGNVVVIIPLIGNQTTYSSDTIVGTQVILNTDMVIKELTPTVSASIKAYIYNEKAIEYKAVDEEAPTVNGLSVGFASRALDFIAPTGVITKGTISNFNSKNTTIATNEISSTPVMGKLEIYSSRKTAKMTASVLNNYGRDCENVRILGRIPAKEAKSIINLDELNSTFDTILKDTININGIDMSNIQIYYSENINATPDINNPQNGWIENPANVSNVKSYLIVLKDYVLKQGKGLSFNYDFEIPENLDFGESSFGTYAVLFNDMEEDPSIFEYAEAPQLGVGTGEGPDLDLKVTSTAGNGVVHEKEIIKYTVELENNGSEEVTNVQIKNIIPEGFTFVKYENVENEEQGGDYTYVKYPEIREYYFETIAEINPGEKIIKEYEVIADILTEGIDEITVESYSAVLADEFEGEIKSIGITNTIKKAELDVRIVCAYTHTFPMLERKEVQYVISVENMSENVINDIWINDKLSDGFEYVDAYIGGYDDESGEYTKTRDNIIYDEQTNTIKYNLDSLDAGNTKQLIVIVKGTRINSGETTKMAEHMVTVDAQGHDTYRARYANYIEKADLDINIKSNITEEIIREGAQIEYTITIKNNSPLVLGNITTFIDIPEGTTYVSTNPIVMGNLEEGVRWASTLLSGDEREYKLTVKVDELPEGINQKIINATAKVSTDITDEISSETLTYLVEKEDIDDPDDPDNKFIISGTAWLDENRNGIKDNLEKILPNTYVLLLDKNTDNKINETYTNNEGLYVFSDVVPGEYYIAFIYDDNNYDINTYEKSGLTKISVVIDNITKTAGATDTITVNNSNIYNINFGLVTKAEFELSLNKVVTGIILKNQNGTQVISYDDSKLAKVDIAPRYVNGMEVAIEYTLYITNKGNIPGYARKIADYVPKNVIFDKDINSKWTVNPDGNIYSTELANEIINPGETKQIKLVFIKTMTNQNTGLITNTAEITEVHNDEALPNKSSAVGSLNTAEALITVSTGSAQMYFIVILIAGAILRNRDIYNKQKSKKTSGKYIRKGDKRI